MKYSRYDIQTLSGRRAVRAFANAKQANLPIDVVLGSVAPHEEGYTYYWTTPSGARCWHPSAYRAHFGRPVYNASTRRVVVGAEWLTIADSVLLAVAA